MMLRKSIPALAAAGALSLMTVPAKAVDLTVTHWGVLMYGVPFAVAWDQGYFEEEGIEVDGFITSQGGGTTLRNALASEVPYGETALAAVAAAAQEGLELTIVHAGVRSVGDLLWATRSDAEDINSIEDLEGRPVGYTSPRSVSQSVLYMSMDAAGIATDDYDPRSLGGVGSGLTALDEGVVDAALVLELVLLDTSNPRSLLFQFEQLQSQMNLLPEMGTSSRELQAEQRAVLEAITTLRLKRLVELAEVDSESGRRECLDQTLSHLHQLLSSIGAVLSDKYFDLQVRPQQLVRAVWEG